MEQVRQRFKVSSILVLVFAGLYLLQLIAEILYGDLSKAAVPEGAPDNIWLITRIALISVAVLFLLSQTYVGVKGLRIAKNPSPGKAHIVWATILLTFTVLSLVTPIVNIVKQGGIYDNSMTILSILLEVSVYFDYIKYAREVGKRCSVEK